LFCLFVLLLHSLSLSSSLIISLSPSWNKNVKIFYI
jgi:hypothetical protein